MATEIEVTRVEPKRITKATAVRLDEAMVKAIHSIGVQGAQLREMIRVMEGGQGFRHLGYERMVDYVSGWRGIGNRAARNLLESARIEECLLDIICPEDEEAYPPLSNRTLIILKKLSSDDARREAMRGAIEIAEEEDAETPLPVVSERHLRASVNRIAALSTEEAEDEPAAGDAESRPKRSRGQIVLDGVDVMKKPLSALRSARGATKKIREGGSVYGTYLTQETLDSIENALRDYRFAIPYVVCTACKGHGVQHEPPQDDCEVCAGLGWLTEDRYKSAKNAKLIR